MAETKLIDPKVVDRLRALIEEAEASRAEGPSITADELLGELRAKLAALEAKERARPRSAD